MSSPKREEPIVASAVFNVAPEGNLSRYLQEIRKFPMLTPQEELSLAHRWRDSQDLQAAHQLVSSHLRLVAKIAMGYRGYGLPVGELISEGNVGMMRAVERFDPDRGFRLATYAMWWIRAAIQEYVLHSWSLVKMGTTAAQKKLFFNLRRLKGQMQAIDDGDLQPEQVTKIARTLAVGEQDVISMNQRLTAPDYSLNAPMGQDSDMEWQDSLVDESDCQETSVGDREELADRKALLARALDSLNERERHILIERRLKDDPASLEDLALKYNVSRERIRQIEVRAFEKLRKAVKVRIADCMCNDPSAGARVTPVAESGRRDARVRSNWSQTQTPSRSPISAIPAASGRGSER
jgi:RNA polymerase sigma-32 factor